MSEYTETIAALLADRRRRDGCCIECGTRLNGYRRQAHYDLCGNCDESRPPDPHVPGGKYGVYLDGEIDHGQ